MTISNKYKCKDTCSTHFFTGFPMGYNLVNSNASYNIAFLPLTQGIAKNAKVFYMFIRARMTNYIPFERADTLLHEMGSFF